MRRLLLVAVVALALLGIRPLGGPPHAEADHVDPIRLVHGFSSSSSAWNTMIPRFQADGWHSDQLFAIIAGRSCVVDPGDSMWLAVLPERRTIAVVKGSSQSTEEATMALTLTEAAKLSNDVLKVGVIETVIKESPVLQTLPFIEIVGNGLTYNRESAAAAASFFDVGDTWTESTPTFTQQTATLKILGGDADVDNFLVATRSNVQDLEAAIVQLKAKAVQQKFDDTFVNGDVGVDAKSFDGIDKLTTSGQTTSMGTNGGTFTLAKLDELIDLVLGGKPDLLLMSKRTRRTLNGLARTSGGFLETDRNEFGQMVQFYDGVPIGISDYISDAKTVGTSTDCSTIYAVQFGEGGVAGLSAPGGLEVERVGSLETRDATRTRVKWYVALALFNTLKLAKLTGVRP